MTVLKKIKYFPFPLATLLSLSCVSPPHAPENQGDDPRSRRPAPQGGVNVSCEKYYNSQAKSPLFFFGYGTGYDVDAAKQAASVDLVSQIRTHITSTTTVSDSSQGEVEVSSDIQSKVNEYVTGLRVIKRCQERYHEAVVRLSKRDFTSGVEQGLATKLQRARELLETVQATSQSARVLMQARAFLKQEKEGIESDLQVCRMFKGCQVVSLAPLKSLKQKVETHFPRLSFRFEPVGKEARMASQGLRSVLSQEGVVLAAAESESANSARARCEEFVYPKNESISYRIAEVKCEVRGFSNGEEAFVYKYIGKASHSDAQAAIAVARTRLRKP